MLSLFHLWGWKWSSWVLTMLQDITLLPTLRKWQPTTVTLFLGWTVLFHVCVFFCTSVYLSASISHFLGLRVSSAWGPGADLSCRSAGQHRETDPQGQTAMATQPLCFCCPSLLSLSCVHSILFLRTAVMCRDTKRGQLSSLITFHQLSLLLPWADRLMELSRLLALSVKGNWCSSNILRLFGKLNLSIFSVFWHCCW